MSAPKQALINFLLKQYAPEFENLRAALLDADHIRAAWVVAAFARDYPGPFAMIENFLFGTPRDVVDLLSLGWPEVRDIPEVEQLIANLQTDARTRIQRARFAR